jgi:hypothetical protein
MELSTLLDPVDALAYHFRSFGAELAANKTPLRFVRLFLVPLHTPSELITVIFW